MKERNKVRGMRNWDFNLLRLPGSDTLIAMESAELLSEVTIDDYHFKVTLNPIDISTCIIWFRDTRITELFEALGKFTHFDKKKVLKFIVRYVTSPDLREEIHKRRFEKRLESLPPEFFRNVKYIPDSKKELAYRDMFNLDVIIEKRELDKKRRIMAKKFHPDAGGDHKTMSVINEAYEFLMDRASH